MGPVERIERATAWTKAKIEATSPDRFGDRTPCADWDVRSLINHLIGGGRLYALIARGGYDGARFGDRDFIGEDAVASYEEARRDALESFDADGALDRVVLGTVGEAPGVVMATLLFVDHLLHGWDLAKATGQDATMPAELATAAWNAWEGTLPDDIRGEGRPFAVAVELGTNVTTQDKLIAYTGRDPSWT